VCGKRAWGTRKKYRATISDVTLSDTGAFIVMVSDEAFALLLLMPTLTSGSRDITRTEMGSQGRNVLWENVPSILMERPMNMVAGVKRGFADSINCARWYKRTELVEMQGMPRSG
jgi:hypothetical protein